MLRTKTFLVRSIEPVRSVVSRAQLPLARYQKATCITASPISCSYVFAGSGSGNCFRRRDLSSQKRTTKKSSRTQSSCKNLMRKTQLATSESKSRSVDDDKRYVTAVNEVKAARRMETPGVSLMSNDSVGIFQRVVCVSANFRTLMKTARC